MKRILITGADSYIGMSFEAYIKEHYPNDYVVDTINMMDKLWYEKDFSGYDSVFHVAGIAHSDNGKISAEKANLYYKVNTDLTIETAKKSKIDGVKQFIFMSSAIVYGESAPIGKQKVITRDTPVSPVNCYGDSKVQAENGIHILNDETFNVVILRPPMIYGRGCKGNYPLLSKISKNLPIFPYVKNERSVLYIENLCEFVRLIIDNEEEGTFWPQNSEYSNTSELIKKIAAVHGKRVILLNHFSWALKIMSYVTGLVNKAFGNFTYDMSISEYAVPYAKVGTDDSIKKTEKGDNSHEL